MRVEQLAKIRNPFLAIVAVIAGGTIGYHQLTNWSWFDSLYMTLTTLTTIGYGEPSGMTQQARYFTVVFIIVGVSTVGYAVAITTKLLIESEILLALGRRKVSKEAGKLRNHFVICGAGRVGSRVAKEMASKGVDFVIIERDNEVADKMSELGYLVVRGDATDEQTLTSVSIAHAQGIVCAAPSDADNVYMTLMARDMNPAIYIVARANEESAEPKLIKAGANKVVSPNRIGSHQMAQALLQPAVSQFIELTTMGSEELGLEEILIAEKASFAGRPLKHSGIRERLDVMVVAIRRSEGEMLFNPSGETELKAGDRLIAVGKRSNLTELEKFASSQAALREEARSQKTEA
jgi:voltage-gated potassium channel